MNRRRFLRQTALGAAALSGPIARAAMQNTPAIPLDGVWRFTRNRPAESWKTAPADGAGWSDATVPGCWERDGVPGAFCGPAYLRRDIVPPVLPAGMRLFWECDALSYHARASVNGEPVGEHTGLWDRFAWEIPPALRATGRLALALEIEKPGSARFPVPQTLAGFLPYVWGTWGGLWQPTRLRATGPARIERVRAFGSVNGQLDIEVDLDIAAGPAAVQLLVRAPGGEPVGQAQAVADRSGTVNLSLRIGTVEKWSPESPVLYTVEVEADTASGRSDTRTRRVGFRDITVESETILLNGVPIYFRAPLSWGWYEAERAPAPSDAHFEAELRRIKELGFNGVKLCLWIPPERYFDLADRLGMLLWVELPIWLPEGTSFFRDQTPAECRRIVAQIADHPSIVLWTLGCEIGRGVDAEFLGTLYRDVKRLTRSPLVRDNSGSAECYGGPVPEHADYWDFHLYCDPPLARSTFDAFAPRWRERQPFLFGEFSDQDALRDLPAILKRAKTAPWWTLDDAQRNPKGVRWEHGVTSQLQTLTDNGLIPRLPELKESSRKQALLTRKHTLELTRSYPFTAGYVVTGLADTPISTAGIVDDFGEARFTAAELAPINADTVLFIEPDRRRAWTAGGDRPSWLDRWCVRAGESVRRHVGVSHFGLVEGVAQMRWSCGDAWGEGSAGFVRRGDIRQIGTIELTAPSVTQPTRLVLEVSLALPDGNRVTNAWPLWVFPPAASSSRSVALFDPGRLLAGFEAATGLKALRTSAQDGVPLAEQASPLWLATAWRPELLALAANGARVLYLQPAACESPADAGLPAPPLPFFREAMRLFEPHASWGSFPHARETSLLFYGIASDCAFDRAGLRAALPNGVVLEPILTRVDARSSVVHDYAVAVRIGAGRLLLSTLRPYGGLGDQPSGLSRSVGGSALLRTWLDWLAN